ncbi:unnamed protein product [Thelazia callipaeda]|uniref:Gamma-tubulin complex component n=1 Tax=Thelazia callipaeda TaxID=103827 RepID=A0A0N5CK60_THECL|nr:unnamed protein product [Thelazia callipaeda]
MDHEQERELITNGSEPSGMELPITQAPRSEFEITEKELVSHLLTQVLYLYMWNTFSSTQKSQKLYFQIDRYVFPLIEPHSRLRELMVFSKKNSIGSEVEKVLQEYVLEFFVRHTRAMSELYTAENQYFFDFLFSISSVVLAIDITYDCLSVVMNAETWSYEKAIVGTLQHVVLPIIERYFDPLFTTGEINALLEGDFPFISSENTMELQTREQCSPFWTTAVIQSVKDGVLNARRLRAGSYDYEAPTKFSVHFKQALKVENDYVFIPAQIIMASMEYACRKCAKSNSVILFRAIQEENKLPNIFRNMELVYTGSAIREMICELYGATRITEDTSLILSFRKSLRLRGFSDKTCEEWTIHNNSGHLYEVTIKPKVFSLLNSCYLKDLMWPFNFLIEENLLRTLNMCLCFMIRLLQAHDALLSMQADFIAAKKVVNNDYRLIHLVCSIAQPISAISEIFYAHLQTMVSKKFALVTASKNLEEAQSHLKDLDAELYNLVKKSDTTTLIHDAIEALCCRARELESRWRNNDITLSDVPELLKIVQREKELLIGLGNSMPGTIFEYLQPMLM